MWGRTVSAPRTSERFAARRRQRRRRALVAGAVLLLVATGSVFYLLQRPTFRIERITIEGGDESLATIVKEAMTGSYLGLVPRDSSFFFPKETIRSEILAASPVSAAVSLSRKGLSTLAVTITSRIPLGRWCGDTPPLGTSTPPTQCFSFDADGVLYTASTTDTINTFTFYEPVDHPAIGTTLPNVETFPRAFDFARQVKTLGSPVVSVSYRDGEVDDLLQSGTRVTYVLGKEQMAFSALVSAKGDLDLADGSLDYVDLRFDGRVYVKRVAEEAK